MLNFLKIKPEVETALRLGQPVVALESTIISHGMPYPINLETAREVESIVRNEGAVPATIAVIEGKICIGLEESELELLGKNESRDSILKLSRRDLPYALALKKTGATTVAATMICAHQAGIRVFATGGLGGVHREAEKTFDISADLQELAKTPVAVVCAGAKSILDIGLTLEVLETLGVPVFGYKTDFFPAFYSSQSKFRLDYRVDHCKDLASVIRTKTLLSLEGGLVVATPVPKEDEIPAAEVEEVIQEALREATRRGIHGKETTPFLLSYLVSKTQGKTLRTNVSLIKNNARVGAQIANELSKLE
jgi:pseudouridine-5'-phosphate glycosidase